MKSIFDYSSGGPKLKSDIQQFNNLSEKLEELSRDIVFDELNTYYNCSILNSVDGEIKDKVQEKINKGDNPVLKRLLSNYFSKQQPTPQALGGVNTLWVMESPKRNQKIYIIGETHEMRHPDCGPTAPSFYKFLKKFINTTDVFLDIFVEIPMIDWKR